MVVPLLLVLVLSGLQSSAFSAPIPAEIEEESRCTPRALSGALEDLNLLHVCQPSTRVLLVPYLWKPIQIDITCPKRSYQVFTAANEQDLQQRIKRGETTWCVFDYKTFDAFGSKVCHLQLSPFEKTLVGVKGSKGCTVTSHERFSILMLASGVLGLLLFYNAGALSSSFMFRMSCGTAFFSATFIALALVVIFRCMPYKKTMATVFAATGTSGMVALHWLTGQWLPSWRQLYGNPYFALYMVVTVTLGAVITYLYDDMKNPKINTVIKVILRLVALTLIYYSTWTSWPIAATVMGLMLAGLLGPGVARGVHETGARVHQAVEATKEYLSTPFTARRRARSNLAHTPLPGVSGLRPQRTPAAAPTPLHSALNTHTPAPSMFDEDVDMSLTPLDYSGLRAMHPKATPPAPWEVMPKRRVKTFEEQTTLALLQQHSTGAGRRGAAAGGAGPSSSGVPRGSGTRGGGELEEGSQDTGGISAVLQQGYIVNPTTGRLIKIGGDVYLHLLSLGYAPDVREGRLVAPEGGVDTGPRSRQSGGRSRTSARLR